ncbi:type I restriction enzyme endonuclease domain-containing protein, partial [Staphylococcus hominis]|uniref:type I restriction enzyme endonuclease domain-containing protein n=1 Tax=Staphylococcus hominis TaxID=1290 RepID=UPI0011A6276A
QPKTPKTPPQLQPHINQLLSQSLLTQHLIHLYQTLPLQQPHLSILSHHFLKHLQPFKQKNLPLQLLNPLLKPQLKSLIKTNPTLSKPFSQILPNSINKYNTPSIQTSKV